MTRDVRHQAAIVRNLHILLIQVREHADGRTFWMLPGGGMEDGESPEECVAREVFEETGLRVRVMRILRDDPDPTGWYQILRTYLCDSHDGDPVPGCEPEAESAALSTITAVAWYDLRRPETWGAAIHDDPITLPLLLAVRERLVCSGDSLRGGQMV